ncbi:hypothetical protein [Caenimonas soli]|uniref:hypothetical protein n=1 Tax=Caenimonas soli TaxID=2735555 RepID=UPI0015582EC0|nr:hypothetical protein [Caenimonas soli]NPC58628.1 hypothetical protein [Caenimonas soli]
MNILSRKRLFPAVALGLLLSGCGGGSDEPDRTPISATLTITAATNASLNGIYTTNTVSLAAVEKINPIGSEPEVCSFRFSGLAGPGGMMDGDIRYLPGTPVLRVVFVSINGLEFSSRDIANAAVDRTGNEVDFTGKVLTASTGVASTITLTGSMPMRGNRPEGC